MLIGNRDSCSNQVSYSVAISDTLFQPNRLASFTSTIQKQEKGFPRLQRQIMYSPRQGMFGLCQQAHGEIQRGLLVSDTMLWCTRKQRNRAYDITSTKRRPPLDPGPPGKTTLRDEDETEFLLEITYLLHSYIVDKVEKKCVCYLCQYYIVDLSKRIFDGGGNTSDKSVSKTRPRYSKKFVNQCRFLEIENPPTAELSAECWSKEHGQNGLSTGGHLGIPHCEHPETKVSQGAGPCFLEHISTGQKGTLQIQNVCSLGRGQTKPKSLECSKPRQTQRMTDVPQLEVLMPCHCTEGLEPDLATWSKACNRIVFLLQAWKMMPVKVKRNPSSE